MSTRPHSDEPLAADRLARTYCVEPGCDRPREMNDQRCVLHAARLGTLAPAEGSRSLVEVMEEISAPQPAGSIPEPAAGDRWPDALRMAGHSAKFLFGWTTLACFIGTNKARDLGVLWLVVHALGGIVNLVLALRLFGGKLTGKRFVAAVGMVLIAVLLLTPEMLPFLVRYYSLL